MMETKTAMMPRELTAENGAKKLLLGEFKEPIEMTCECLDDEGNPNEGCVACAGTGVSTALVHVSWTTIKEIYAMAVKHLEVK